MGMKKEIFISLFILACTLPCARSQTLFNNCPDFHISPGAVLSVSGDFRNDSSAILTNQGHFIVDGSFSNSGNFSSDSLLSISGDLSNSGIISLGGTVTLFGNNQTLYNNYNNLPFHHLTLTGYGIKMLQCPVSVSGILDLTDRELSVALFSLTIINPDSAAVLRSSGFVSTLDNGKMYRYTNRVCPYMFPLGSSLGTHRYRPVEITPGSSSPFIYFANFINNPSAAMPTTSHDGSFCYLNAAYHHSAGGSSFSLQDKISIYFSPSDDFIFNAMANWSGGMWHLASPVTGTPGTSLSSLTLNNWNNQTQSPLILGTTPPATSLPADTAFCSGDSISVSTGIGGGTYAWSDGSSAESLTVSDGGLYTVTITLDLCIISDSILVTEITAPVAYAGNDTALCLGETITLTASGGNSYVWSNGSTQPEMTVNPATSTSYTVTVSDGTCSGTDTVTIQVNTPPWVNAGNDTTIYEGQSLTLIPVFSGTITGYSWAPSSSLSSASIPSPVATPSVTTTYTIVVTDGNGCSSSDAITIEIEEDPNADIILYNTFTPNNDGVNDTWFIENIDRFPDNFLQIFNRNGHLVYEKSGYHNEWDGKYYGNDLPAATYYFVLDLKEDRIIKGDITIIR